MTHPQHILDFFEEEAKDALDDFREQLENTVSVYCHDAGLARDGVDAFLKNLPHHPQREIDGFVAWNMLQIIGSVLRKLTGDAEMLREGKDPIAHQSLTDDDKKPTVDDATIRESAGYTQDEDVAESSLTDKAQDYRISDHDISSSSKDENFTYEDAFEHIPSPAECYRRATHYLFTHLISDCIDTRDFKRLQPIIENALATRHELDRLISRMFEKLGKGLRIPDSDDQMT